MGVYFTYQQLQTYREGQITERFSRAIDHLGNDKEDVRLGGIYTLERIARDSRGDRRTVQTVLGAYVRSHAPWLVGSPDGPQHPTPTVDRQLPWLQHGPPMYTRRYPCSAGSRVPQMHRNWSYPWSTFAGPSLNGPGYQHGVSALQPSQSMDDRGTA